MKTKIIVFALLIIGFISCKKESQPEPQREVRYEIKIANGNYCYYYCDADAVPNANGELKKQYGTMNGSIYSKSNKVNKGDRYRIKVEYASTYKPEYDYQINVYSDGVRIDGIKTAFNIKRPNQGDSVSSENMIKYKIVELTGTIE